MVIFGAIGALVYASVSKLTAIRSELSAASEQLQATTNELKATTGQLDAIKHDLADARKALSDSQSQIAKSQAEIDALRAKLNQVFDFKQHIVPITEIDEKLAYSALGPKGFDLVRLAMDDARRKLPFNGANDPAKGFISPGYAQYLLGKVGIHQTIESLKPRLGQPKNGDIIVFAPAYAMFYFSIPEVHKEFVIGMTPEGVLSLDPNFGTQIGVRAALQP
jgi:hypothetical protein